MCEPFAMSSRHPATVTISLDELSRHGGLTGPHRDGWGIASYAGADVRLIKEPQPASDSAYVRFIEQHDIRSRTVISHIRRATRGEPSLANSQPFCRELGGRMHVFAHNGDLPEIARRPGFGLGRFRPVDTTDSEHAFCALLATMEPLWLNGDRKPSLPDRLGVLVQFAASLRALGPANFLYCDGETLFVHAHERRQDGMPGVHPPGLHVLRRSCPAEPRPFSGQGVTIQWAADSQEVVLVASVPLTGEGWAPLGKGEILAVANGLILERLGA
ncbi:MAG: class II glutamine amidotransferase [Thermodesulfobacteriota bacterium]